MGATKSKWIGRAEERLGRALQTVGAALGDRELAAQGRGKEREGHARKVAAKAILRLKRTVERVAGSAQAWLGRLSNDVDLERRGRVRSRRAQVRVAANRDAPPRSGDSAPAPR